VQVHRLGLLRHGLAETCLTYLHLNQHGIKIPTLNLGATVHYELRLGVHRLPASVQSDARVVVLLTLACKGAPDPSTNPGRADRHTKPRGKVSLELLRRDGRLVSTHECDEDKVEVRT
jgi:hypothetical protein